MMRRGSQSSTRAVGGLFGFVWLLPTGRSPAAARAALQMFSFAVLEETQFFLSFSHAFSAVTTDNPEFSISGA